MKYYCVPEIFCETPKVERKLVRAISKLFSTMHECDATQMVVDGRRYMTQQVDSRMSCFQDIFRPVDEPKFTPFAFISFNEYTGDIVIDLVNEVERYREIQRHFKNNPVQLIPISEGQYVEVL